MWGGGSSLHGVLSPAATRPHFRSGDQLVLRMVHDRLWLWSCTVDEAVPKPWHDAAACLAPDLIRC